MPELDLRTMWKVAPSKVLRPVSLRPIAERHWEGAGTISSLVRPLANVAVGAKAAVDTLYGARQFRVVMLLVSSVDVGNVHLDDRSCKRLEGVEIAIEVKAYPAGLMMMASGVVRAD